MEQLRELKELGLNEISLGVESDDDETLKRITKVYTSQDILDQTKKLDEAGIRYWMTFLNGVGGKDLSHQQPGVFIEAVAYISAKFLNFAIKNKTR